MANVDTKFGLRPTRNLDGTPITSMEVYVPSTDTTAIGIGDPVIYTGTANSTIIQGRPVGMLPEVARAATSGLIHGVVSSVQLVTDDSLPYRAASTTRILNVVPATGAGLVCEIQSNGTSAITSVGNNANVVFTSTPNTVTGVSQAELNESSVASTATLQLKILGFSKAVDNEVGADGKYEVLINTSGLANATAGV